MKFIHIADLHLGKTLYQQNLLSVQADLLEQVLTYMNQKDIEVLVIAGDIYDRSVPSGEAIEVLNAFLYKAIFESHKQVLMISGNHDSSERLNFASELLKAQGLHIVSFPQKIIEPIVIEDINFYLVPFFKPSAIRYIYDAKDILTYQDAFARYLSDQNIDYTKTNVLITHQFIAGNKEVITSDSEVVLSVGGSEIIDVSLVEDFDYVAMGHLHASQKVKLDTIRYSGSLMKYSFDEVKQTKGMVEVTIEGKDVNVEVVPLHPYIDLEKYKGTFSSFLDDKIIQNKENYLAFELEDTMVVPNAIDRLREIYPNILQITYPTLLAKSIDTTTKANVGFEKLNPLDLYTEFYEKIKGEELEESSKKIVEELLVGGDCHVA